MAHVRNRQLEPEIRSSLTWAPSVGILGMRQTGKTTLLKKFSKSYFAFDDPLLGPRFEREGSALLESGPFPMGIDEAQKSPALFDTLKLLIDRRKTPGKYLLSGSVRFASRRAVRESLTGRIALLELFPLTLAESHSKRPSEFLARIMESDANERAKEICAEKLRKSSRFTTAEFTRYLDAGGLPGICFKREPAVRSKMFENHLDTLLGRDLEMVYGTRLRTTTVREMLRLIALGQGEALNQSAIARKVSVSLPTVQRLMGAFESLFLVRKLGHAYYIEDAGLSSHLSGGPLDSFAFEMKRFVFQELRAQIAANSDARFALDSYSTRGGIDIPFIVMTPKKKVLALTIDADEVVSAKNLRGLALFAQRHTGTRTVALHLGTKAYVSSQGVLCLPWNWLA